MKKTLLAILLTAFYLNAFTQITTDITSNLIAHYSFTGGAVTSSVGTDNNATLNGASTIAGIDFQDDNAFAFGPNRLVNLPDEYLLRESISISLWFKSTKRGGMFGYQDTDAYGTLGLYVPIAYLGSDGKIYAGFWSGSKINVNTLTTTYNDGKWHHLVLTADADSQSLYLDNIFAGSISSGHTILSDMKKAQLGTAGTSGWDNVGGASWYDFLGEMDEVRIYDTPIDASVVNAIYDLESPFKQEIEITTPKVDFGDTDVETTKIDSFYVKAPSDNTDPVDVNIVFDEDRNPSCPLPGVLNTFYVKNIFNVSVNGSPLISEYGVIVFTGGDDQIGNQTITLAPGDSAVIVVEATPIEQRGWIVPDGLTAFDQCDFGMNTALSLGVQSDEISIQNLSTGEVEEIIEITFNGTNEPNDELGLFDLKNDDLKIYPNPATTVLNTEEGALNILDLTGNTILSTESTGKIDVSGFKSGIYILIQNDKTTKLIIE